MSLKTKEIDAYRYFFPTGWSLGLWGVLLWILFPDNLVRYPGLMHPEIMMGGFFLCFVCGFLMTAAPKFTVSFGPTKTDQNISLGLISLMALSLLLTDMLYFQLVVTLLFVFLILFIIRRFRVRKANPPDSFLFIAFGLGCGIVGSLILLSAKLIDIPLGVYSLGRLFFLQAYILCLVLGVGSRLIPALLGWTALPNSSSNSKPRIFLLSSLGTLFVTSYILEAGKLFQLAQILRLFIIGFIAFAFWKIHKLPKRRGFQSFSLWVSAWALIFGQSGVLLFPLYRTHFLHIIFISGLGLMTFMIATRVILAHGHHGMQMENSSKGLLLGTVLIVLAGLTRLFAGLVPQHYESHLFYSASVWFLGLILWGFLFLPKIVFVNHHEQR